MTAGVGWDPDLYRRFDGHRARPFLDLVARIQATDPRVVADVGCGPGHLTELLAHRWPAARIEASDASVEMVAAARDNGVEATVVDARDWSPGPDTDVVVSNAVLHWIPEHRELMSRWVAAVPADGWVAVQMPGNESSPSHTLVRDLLAEPAWADAVPGGPATYGVGEPAEYARLLVAARPGTVVDAWQTTYVHPLTGPDPVLDWIAGTTLRPVRAVLDDAGWEAFRGALAPRLRAAYPTDDTGTTWFGFRRVFVVARAGR